jgi:hypothetical protein
LIISLGSVMDKVSGLPSPNLIEQGASFSIDVTMSVMFAV